MVLATPSFADPTCRELVEACDQALKAQDAQAEALKQAVKDARKEADECYAKSKDKSSGDWLLPLAIGLGTGIALGLAVGR